MPLLWVLEIILVPALWFPCEKFLCPQKGRSPPLPVASVAPSSAFWESFPRFAQFLLVGFLSLSGLVSLQSFTSSPPSHPVFLGLRSAFTFSVWSPLSFLSVAWWLRLRKETSTHAIWQQMAAGGYFWLWTFGCCLNLLRWNRKTESKLNPSCLSLLAELRVFFFLLPSFEFFFFFDIWVNRCPWKVMIVGDTEVAKVWLPTFLAGTSVVFPRKDRTLGSRIMSSFCSATAVS